ncbi:hypothetical protein AABB24_017479, partial [Solanum stoloniferum]
MVHDFRGRKSEKWIGTRANSEFPTNSQIQNLYQDQRIAGFCMRFRLKSQKIWTRSSVDGFNSSRSPLCLTCHHLVATRAIGRGWQDWNGLVRADACFFREFRRSTAAALTFLVFAEEEGEHRWGRYCCVY